MQTEVKTNHKSANRKTTGFVKKNNAIEAFKKERLAKKVQLQPIKNKQTRRDIVNTIAHITQLKTFEIEAVFDATHAIIEAHINKKGSGEIQIPKLGLKIKRITKKPTKSRKMHSSLIKQDVHIPGKPSRSDVKIVALKPLKSILEPNN